MKRVYRYISVVIPIEKM
jgi:hypothetical protein